MKKSYWIIIALFVILLIIATIMFIPKPDNKNGKQKEDITKIVIKQSKEGLPLRFDKITGESKKEEDEEDKWKFTYGEEHKISGDANNRTVNDIVDSIKEIDLNELKVIIKNTEESDYLKYEVDDSLGIFVDVYYEKQSEPIKFILGKTDENGKRTFIRLPEREKIYSTFGNHRRYFNKSLDEYRDKTIFEYEPDDIVKVEYTTEDGKTIILEKEVTKQIENVETTGDETEKDTIEWKKSETGEVLDKEAVNKAVKQISKLKASSFYDGPSEDILNKEPIFEVTYEEASGKAYNLKVLMLVNEEDEKENNTLIKDNYVVQRSDIKNPIYLVSKYTIDNLIKLREVKTQKEIEAEKEAEKEEEEKIETNP